MHWRNSIGFIFLVFFGCTSSNQEHTDTPNHSPNQSKYLIEAAELETLLSDPTIKVIDFRRSASFDLGHIPNALNFWRRDIENPEYPFPGMLASASQLESLFRKVGIQSGDQLIVYDDVGSCDATRFWWVMQQHGFKDLRILDGGLDAWKAENRELSTNPPNPEVSNFTFTKEPKVLGSITTEELQAALASADPPTVLDTRTLDEFSGKRQKSGAAASGHISNAIHLDWVENVNQERKLKSLQELAGLYESLGLSKDQQIITYCHSGVRSSLTYFVLTELLGYTNVRNYDGSWVAWTHHQLPTEQDTVTTIFE